MTHGNPFVPSADYQRAHEAHRASSSIRLDEEWVFAPMTLPKLAEAVETERVLNGIDTPSEIVMSAEQADEYPRLLSPLTVANAMLSGMWPPPFRGIPVRVAS